jgi:hypothetical protein
MNDPIEQRHNATNARIHAGAKAGKYWLLRSEEREMDEWTDGDVPSHFGQIMALQKLTRKKKMSDAEAAERAKKVYNSSGPQGKARLAVLKGGRQITETTRQALINKIIEDTLSGNIGVVNMPMGINRRDPAMGGRNKFTKDQLRFAISQVKNQTSSR